MSSILFSVGSEQGTPATGKVIMYVKSDKLLYTKDDGGTERAVLGQKDPESKSVVIENPSGEDFTMFFTDVAITITKMVCVLIGTTPSVDWTVRHATDRSAAGAEVVTGGTTTTSTTTGDTVTVFNDATIIADSFVWVETSGESGTVTSMSLIIFYTED